MKGYLPGVLSQAGRVIIMSLQFPIADMFTRIRNGLKVFRHSVSISYSNVNKAILDLLVREGYMIAPKLSKMVLNAA